MQYAEGLTDAAAASEGKPASSRSDQVVALTGGSGRVGQRIREALKGKIRSIRILDTTDPGDLREDETWTQVDICDFGAMRNALDGVDAVIHLAGYPGERAIEDILRVNVLGTHNLYEAARELGIKRVVLGSSNHATGFYPRDQQVPPDGLMRPDSFYGLGKCWNELEAGLYFEKFGIRSLIIRIANATIDPHDPRSDARSLGTWVSPRDLAQLILIGLEHPDIDCTTVYGVSQTEYDWWDNSTAAKLGYRPADRGTARGAAPSLSAQASTAENTQVADYFQGGRFCAKDHDGAIRRRRVGP